MLDEIRTKVKALVADFPKTGVEVFTYTTSPIFTIAEPVFLLTKVLLDSIETDDYEFDSTTNKIEITSSALGTNSIIEVDYTYYKYSITEIDGYIRSALVFISVYSRDDDFAFELEGESADVMEIVPTTDSHTEDLIALVASIILKPNWISYKLPNLTVTYPEKMSKEERISKLVSKFNEGLGDNYILNFNIYPYNY